MLNPDIFIRAYQASDARATHDAFANAIRVTASQHYDQTQINAWAPTAVVDLAAWNARRVEAWTVVALLDGRGVGFSDLADGGLLDMLFVRPDAGGRGVARALVTAVLDHARAVGLSSVVTHASRVSRPAFERLGFVVDAENLHNMVRGVAIPNYDMHIDLP